MAADEQVLAEMDCFHSYYRFCSAESPGAPDRSRYEAWLSYRQAILRRDGHRCSQCGKVRPAWRLDVRPREAQAGTDRLAPENLVSVCISCEDSAAMMWWVRRHSRLA